MARSLVLVIGGLCLGLVGLAEERPFKIHPPNAETYADDMKFVEGEERKTTALVARRLSLADGTTRDQTTLETVAVPTPKRRWLLGATGWHDSEGLTLETIAPKGPLSAVRVDDGDESKIVTLKTQDVIAVVESRPMMDAFTLYHALQTAPAPGDVRIEWIDAATGQRRQGVVRLTPVRE